MSDDPGHNPAKELLEEGTSLPTLHPSAALRAPEPEDRRRIRRQLTDDLRTALEIAGDDG